MLKAEKKGRPRRSSSSGKKNTLAQIIDIVKKNEVHELKKNYQYITNFNSFTCSLRNGSKLEEQKRRTLPPWIDNENEQNLAFFWSYIDEHYFGKMKQEIVDKISLLIEQLKEPVKGVNPKFSDPESYETFTEVISPKIKTLYPDPEINRKNLRNLEMRYLLSTLKISDIPKDCLPSVTKIKKHLDLWENNNHILKLENTVKYFHMFLEEEKILYQRALKELGVLSTLQSSEISKKIDEYVEKAQALAKQNIEKLQQLKEKAMGEEIPDIRCAGSEPEKQKRGRGRPKKYGPISIVHTETSKIELDYLRMNLIHLENAQAAESIKFVIDAEDTGEKRRYGLVLEDAITKNEIWVDERTLEKLENLREFPIPWMTPFPVESNCINYGEKGSWKELADPAMLCHPEKMRKEEIIIKSREYGMCHFCRTSFLNDDMIKCHYKSKKMGYPQCKLNNSDPLIMGTGNKVLDQVAFKNNQRNIYSLYHKRENHLVCNRKFCVNCLTQVFNFKLNQIASKTNWICPFCTGACFCNRCLRNGNISKLVTLMIRHGGTIRDIQAKSYFEKFKYPKESKIIKQSYPKVIKNKLLVILKKEKSKSTEKIDEKGPEEEETLNDIEEKSAKAIEEEKEEMPSKDIEEEKPSNNVEEKSLKDIKKSAEVEASEEEKPSKIVEEKCARDIEEEKEEKASQDIVDEQTPKGREEKSAKNREEKLPEDGKKLPKDEEQDLIVDHLIEEFVAKVRECKKTKEFTSKMEILKSIVSKIEKHKDIFNFVNADEDKKETGIKRKSDNEEIKNEEELPTKKIKGVDKIVKRGPGRPRTKPTSEMTNRRSPRKDILEEVVVKEEFHVKTEEVINTQSFSPQVKRKRGRPRKNISKPSERSSSPSVIFYEPIIEIDPFDALSENDESDVLSSNEGFIKIEHDDNLVVNSDMCN